MSAVVPFPVTPSLEQLIARRVELKQAADKAAALVKEIDVKIIAALPQKTEGTSSETAGAWKAIATFKVNRKVDVAKVREEWDKIPAEVQAIFKWDAEISLAPFRALSPAHAKILAKYYESKPAATGLKIEAA